MTSSTRSFLTSTGFVFSDTGVQWNNLEKAAGVGDHLTMAQIILMLIVDSVICLLITWYVEAIFPGDEGVPQPWYFPFTVSHILSGRSALYGYESLTGSSEKLLVWWTRKLLLLVGQ